MTAAAGELAAGPSTARPDGRRRVVTEQVTAVAGQFGSGVGNLLYSVVAIRLLRPGDYAELATFLALYLLLHVPAASLSVGSALAPGRERRMRRTGLRIGLGAGAAIAAVGVPLSGPLGLSPGLLLVLAAAGPGAGLLALARGRLYGQGRVGGVTVSLLTEPAVRLTAGIVLAKLVGPVGGAAGVVAAGYCALAVARYLGRAEVAADADDTAPLPAAGRAAVAPVVVFLLLAVLANQDLVWANALLGRGQAAVFAALSTIGGVAAFATATIPLVLLPRAAKGRDPAALRVALAGAGAVGLVAVVAVAAIPTSLWVSALGHDYAETGRLTVAYVGAMALLGLVRVLAAADCARTGGRATLVAAAAAVTGQAVGIALVPRDARSVATVTLSAVAALALAVGTVTVLRDRPMPAARTRLAALGRMTRTRWTVAGLTAAALAVRLVSPHSFWIDEATSNRQAKLPWHALIADLQHTDVHPPLWGVLLWVWVRVFGNGMYSLRAPSIVAGTLVVPMLFVAGRELWDRRAGFGAAALGVVAPFAVWYSQEARMYALFLLFAVAAVWAQARVLRTGGRWPWVAYAVASALLVWTQYFAALQVLAQQLVFLVVVVHRRRRREADTLLRPWLLSIAAVVVLVLPLAPYVLGQLHGYGARGGVGLGGGSSSGSGAAATGNHSVLSIYSIVANVVWAVWGYHSDGLMITLVALWPVLMLLCLLLLGRGLSRSSALLLACVVIPVLAVFALGTQKQNLFEVRYFTGIVPALLLLLGRVVTGWVRTRLGAVLALGALSFSLGVALVDQQLNPANPRQYDYEAAVHRIDTRAAPGDMLVATPGYLANVIGYFENDHRVVEAVPQIAQATRTAPHVFVVGSFLEQRSVAGKAGAVLDALSRQRRIVAIFHTSNVTVWELQ